MSDWNPLPHSGDLPKTVHCMDTHVCIHDKISVAEWRVSVPISIGFLHEGSAARPPLVFGSNCSANFVEWFACLARA